MKIHYDKIADAMYIYLKKAKIKRTIPVNDYVIIDVDEKGNTVGIELLDVSLHQGFDISEKNILDGVPIENISEATVLV